MFCLLHVTEQHHWQSVLQNILGLHTSKVSAWSHREFCFVRSFPFHPYRQHQFWVLSHFSYTQFVLPVFPLIQETYGNITGKSHHPNNPSGPLILNYPSFLGAMEIQWRPTVAPKLRGTAGD